MRLAIAKAKEGIKKGQTPFGACIVKDGKVVACAHNHVWKKTDITAHAEIVAIRQACQKLKTIDLSGCILFSTCEPCPMCFSACHWARVSFLVCGARIQDAQKIGFRELVISNSAMKRMGKITMPVIKDVLRDENLKLFEEFQQKNASKIY